MVPLGLPGERQPVLAGLPVLANLDFGHPNPLATLPLGGRVEVIASDQPRLRILDHWNDKKGPP